jgi:CheY-like chemotaxis protein
VEASLAHKQKLECALQLARTVALDFNNALTSILGHTSLILGAMEPGHPWRKSLIEVEKSAEKAAEIAFDLAAFSRQEKDATEKTAGNLNELLQRAVGLFRSGPGAKLQWTLGLEDRLYSVKFDEAKLQQALVKVLDNAVQAVGPDGQIRVRSRNLHLEETLQDEAAQVAPGYYVSVEITDNGVGIAPADLSRIFEPFFTTKSNPPHRGLGLAWVYGIITNHGGNVAVSSQPGNGASVRIYLPAEQRLTKDRRLKSDDLTGRQTLLMVDDEDLVLTMGQTILSAFGYHVLTASSGARALEIVSADPDQIDLVITDLVMPNMSGRELIDHLRALAPRVRILCTSGYLRSPDPEGEVAYLKKPFTSQELLRKVKQALE